MPHTPTQIFGECPPPGGGGLTTGVQPFRGYNVQVKNLISEFNCSVECYDVDNDMWKLVSPLVERRSGAGAASLNSYVYAIGGYNGDTQLNSVERYHPASDTWTVISPLIHKRSALSATVLCGKLYVVGGYDGDGFLNTLEEYVPEEDRWKLVTSMNLGRSGAGIAVGWKPAL